MSFREFICESTSKRVFAPTASWSDTHTTSFLDGGYSHLRLSYSLGWTDSDLSLLEGIADSLEALEVYCPRLDSITPVQKFQNLKFFGFDSKVRPGEFFQPMHKLRVLKAKYSKSIDPLLQVSSIEELNLTNFSGETLETLSKLGKLRDLKISSRHLSNLNGVQSFSVLQAVDLYGCPSLTSIRSLDGCKEIRAIKAQKCSGIDEIDCIGELKNIEILHLIDCGRIASLSSLSECRNLTDLNFSGNTNIVDGDLSVIRNLPSIKSAIFQNRRHYYNRP